MPCDQLKPGVVYKIAGGRVKFFFTKDGEYAVIGGTNENMSIARGELSKLASVKRISKTIQVEKDGVSVSKVVGTGSIEFINVDGKVTGQLDCNSALNATALVKIFFIKAGLGSVKDIESACDPDPSKKKKKVASRAPKKAPSSGKSSSSSSSKSKKKSAPVEEASDDDSGDDGAGIASDSDSD